MWRMMGWSTKAGYGGRNLTDGERSVQFFEREFWRWRRRK